MNYIKKFSMVLITPFVGLGLMTVPAQASTETSSSSTTIGDTRYDFTTSVSADSSVSVKAAASGKAAVDSKGRLILSYIMSKGLPKSQQGKCDRVKAGKKYVNNFYDSTGKERWKEKKAPKGGLKICKDKKGVWRVVLCGNEIIWKKKVPASIRKVLVKVKTVEKRQQKIWSEAEATAKGKSSSGVKATQATGPCAGSWASAEGEGEFFARSSARAWGWTKSSSTIAIKGEISKLNLKQQSEQQAKAEAKAAAEGSAMTNVNAEIVCNTPPTTPPPPVVPTGDIICANPPHLYVPNGNGLVFCELTRSDGVKPSLSQFSIEGTNDYAYFAQPVATSWRDDSTLNPCPANTLCVRVQVWANQQGMFKYLAKFSNLDQVTGSINIVKDEF